MMVRKIATIGKYPTERMHFPFLSSPTPTSWDTTVMAGVKAAILDYEVAWGMEASHSRAAKCKKRGSHKQGSTVSYHIHRTFT